MTDGSTREDRITMGALKLGGYIAVILLTFLFLFASGDSGDDRGAPSGVTWDAYDVTLDVRQDGSLHVTEAQEVTFEGRYSTGFVEIPMDRIESIDDVAVTLEEGVLVQNDTPWLDTSRDEPQGDMRPAEQVPWDEYMQEPGTFRARQEGERYVIHYAFDPTTFWWDANAANATRTIIVEYDAHGVIRDYSEAAEPWQQFHWMAISGEITAIAPIRSASVTVNLPGQVAADDLVVVPEPEAINETQVTWTQAGMGEGDSFDVQAAFPAITDATSPSWQSTADERDASIEAREARQNAGRLMLILAGVAIVLIGGLVLLYAWYRSIREPHIGPVHETVTAPPGDVPGVLVGSLLDERVDPRDIGAGVLDLHRQGIVTIREGAGDEPERYYLTLNRSIPFRPAWARIMVESVFGDRPERGETRGFSALRDLFGRDRDALQASIDETLVEHGYYEELPATSRKHWAWVLKGFAVAGIVISLAILLWTWSWTFWAIFPAVLGLAMWFFGRRLTAHVAMKTAKGAEAAAMWRAFRRHLESNRDFRAARALEEQRIDYAPWLLAFGMEQGWLSEMNRPTWEAPQRRAGSSAPVRGTWIWGGTSSGATGDRTAGPSRGRSAPIPRTPAWRPTTIGWDPGRWGDLQSGSDSASSAFGSMSDGAFRMVGDMLEAIGNSSGGGGSGGSSFRGSSSRSGGGRSSSSSGGGRRGFG